MKAVVVRAPGRAALEDVALPRAGEGQVLVRVAAAGVCMSDVEVWNGTRPEPYVRYPVIPGHEWCGTVEARGAGVRGLEVGARVAVEGHNFCRRCPWCRRGQTNLCAIYDEHGFTRPGGFAELAAVRADLAHPFPPSLPFEAAALAEPLASVVHGTERAGIASGETVVVVGPGTLGLLAAGRSRVAGAERVVLVGVDRRNEALARAMGATEFLTLDDGPAERVREATGGAGADVVIEAAGEASALPLALDLARRGGRIALLGIAGGGQKVPLEADAFALKDLRVDGIFAYTSASFAAALDLIESGRLDVRPLVTHRFDLPDFEKAFRLLAGREEPVVKVILAPGDRPSIS